MMPSSWFKWAPMRSALAALLVASVTAMVTLVQAVRISDVRAETLPVLPNPASLSAPAPKKALDVDAIFARDVFSIDRVAPVNRYLLPSELEDQGPPGPPLPRVQVLGIALAGGNRSFATAQAGTDRATIVRVGDRLGPYTVSRIEKKQVTFTTPGGGILTVPALTSGSGN